MSLIFANWRQRKTPEWFKFEQITWMWTLWSTDSVRYIWRRNIFDWIRWPEGPHYCYLAWGKSQYSSADGRAPQHEVRRLFQYANPKPASSRDSGPEPECFPDWTGLPIFRPFCSAESPRVPLPAQVQQLPAWNNFVSDVYTTSQKVPTALSFADSTHPTL